MVATAAILLGASEWPKSQGRLTGSPNFSNSVRDFRKYLLDPNGLSIPAGQVLDLFDSEDSPSEIDEEISDFLKKTRERLGGEIQNVILYYVGHGVFSEDGQKYCIALRSTRPENLGASAYRFSSLARTLNRQANQSRRFVILDACYAAAASSDLLPQSQQAELAEEQVISALAESGTALLCAASSSDVALSPKGKSHTMFSEALLYTLTADAGRRGALLSFDDIRIGVDKFIAEAWRDQAVKPELHIPDQRKGDISRIAFFPNIVDRSAIQQADQLKALSGHMEKVLDSLSRMDERLREIENRAPIPQPAGGRDREAERKDGVAAGEDAEVPFDTALEIEKYKGGRRLGRLIFAASLIILASEIYIAFLSVFISLPDFRSSIIPNILLSIIAISILLFIGTISGLIFSNDASVRWFEAGDVKSDLQKVAFSLQLRTFRRLFYVYVVELHLVIWSIVLLIISFVMSWFIIVTSRI